MHTPYHMYLEFDLILYFYKKKIETFNCLANTLAEISITLRPHTFCGNLESVGLAVQKTAFTLDRLLARTQL